MHGVRIFENPSARNTTASPSGHPRVADRAGGTRTMKYSSTDVAPPELAWVTLTWTVSPGETAWRLSESPSDTLMGLGSNVATTVVMAVMVTVQESVPRHPPPLQPVKVDPGAAFAVRVI